MRASKQRLVTMLEQDKEEINEATKAAAIRDFASLAAEYFEQEGELALSVKHVRGGYEVGVSFRAVRIKNFTTLK